MAGRPPTLTKAVIGKICTKIAKGNYRQVAARSCGVNLKTFGVWIQKGKKSADTIYGQLLGAVIEAEQIAEMAMVEIIFRGSKKDPNHAKWWLERKFPDRWGRRDRVELTGNRKKPVEVVEVVVNSREEADQVLARNNASADVPKK